MHRRFQLLSLASLSLVLLLGCSRSNRSSGLRVVRVQTIAPDRAQVPTSVMNDHGAWVVLLASQAQASLVRSTGDHLETVQSVPIASRQAISELLPSLRGPVFAVARDNSFSLRFLSGNTANFPRGEAPNGRNEITPSIALAQDEHDGFSALANFSGQFGTHRIHTRDVGESISYTPQRKDHFSHPALTVAGNLVAVAQQHQVGTFTSNADGNAQLEMIAFRAAPHVAHAPMPIAITDPEFDLTAPRLTAVQPNDASRGVIVTYGTRSGVFARIALPTVVHDMPAFQQHGRTLSLDDNQSHTPRITALGSPDVISIPSCGALFAWLQNSGTSRSLEMRLFRLQDGDFGVPVWQQSVPVEASESDSIVRLGQLGPRVFVATQTAHVSMFEATLDAQCNGVVHSVPIDRSQRDATLLGIAFDDQRAVMATSSFANEYSDATFATFTHEALPHMEHARRRVHSDLRDVGIVRGSIVVAGSTPNGLWIHSLGGDDDEDLLILDSHGYDFAMHADGELDRIWLGNAVETGRTAFGPAQSVIVHSFIGSLEDGPRTEVWSGVVPWADFGRMTLDGVALGPSRVWAATFSASRDSGPSCLSGAYLALFQSDTDEPIEPAIPAHDERWPHTRNLIEPDVRSCSDRVGNIVWSGSHFAVTVIGPNTGSRWIMGDLANGEFQSVTLADSNSALIAPGIARYGRGYVVTWAAPRGQEIAVFVGIFDTSGRPRGTALALSGVDLRHAIHGLNLAIAVDAQNEIAVTYPTDHGAELTRLAFSDPRE